MSKRKKLPPKARCGLIGRLFGYQKHKPVFVAGYGTWECARCGELCPVP